MRITSGELRGRSLVSPRTDITHPMGDRERLALFNALESRGFNTGAEMLYGGVRTAALDAFAGTGALGLEALSRGATHVDFIEKDHRALLALRQNIKTLGLSAKTQVFPTNVVKFTTLPSVAAQHGGYDLIFIDPPYDNFRPADFVHLCQFMKSDALLALSHPAAFAPEGLLQLVGKTRFAHLSTRTYARANISLFRKNLSVS